jgi:hypothetical protein
MSQLFLRAVFYFSMRASSGALTLSVGLGFGYDGCSVAPSSRPWFGIAYVPSIVRTSENNRSGGLQVSECPAGTSIQISRFDHEALAVCRCSYHPASWNEMLTSYEVGSGTRWYGPSGCVRRLRRLLEEESAVRMLVGECWWAVGEFLYQGHQRCFNDGDLVFEPVGFLDQCWRVLRLNTNKESEDSLPFYESGIRS